MAPKKTAPVSAKAATAGTAVQATLHGTRLTLSFPDAQAASVWQVDLAVFSLIGFSLSTSAAKGTQLLFTGDDLPAQALASFPTQAKAEAALAEVNALLADYRDDAQTAGYGGTASAGCTIGCFFKWLARWALRLLGLLIVLGLAYIAWNFIQPDTISDDLAPIEDTAAPSVPQAIPQGVPSAATAPAIPVPPPQGVPVSAEDLLGEE